MNPVSRIAPVSDAGAARMVSPGTAADLAERIMATPAYTLAASAHTSPSPTAAGPSPMPATPGHRPARRWVAGLVAAAVLAVVVLAVTSLARPGQKLGPVTVGPPRARAAALSFSRHHGYIDVIVRNPVASTAVYRAEFAAHHLRIKLGLVPVSPSLVGTVVYMGGSSQITTITAKGRCWTGGGGDMCPVGVRVPDGFHGSADVVFGRAARPGEQYESTGLVTARGEAMHGLAYRGRTVPAVLAMLGARHVTVGRYFYQSGNGSICGRVPRRIPRTWRVWHADPWAPGQVMLWVGPVAGPLPANCPRLRPPVRGRSAPSPSPSASGR